MAKPYVHAKSSAKKYGGTFEDYLDIHDMMDSSKAHIADARHRMVFHSSFGIFIIEQIFGVTRTNSDNKVYSVRDIAEQHVLEDLGFIPTLQDYLVETPFKPWMSGQGKPNSQHNLSPNKPTLESLEEEINSYFFKEDTEFFKQIPSDLKRKIMD